MTTINIVYDSDNDNQPLQVPIKYLGTFVDNLTNNIDVKFVKKINDIQYKIKNDKAKYPPGLPIKISDSPDGQFVPLPLKDCVKFAVTQNYNYIGIGRWATIGGHTGSNSDAKGNMNGGNVMSTCFLMDDDSIEIAKESGIYKGCPNQTPPIPATNTFTSPDLGKVYYGDISSGVQCGKAGGGLYMEGSRGMPVSIALYNVIIPPPPGPPPEPEPTSESSTTQSTIEKPKVRKVISNTKPSTKTESNTIIYVLIGIFILFCITCGGIYFLLK